MVFSCSLLSSLRLQHKFCSSDSVTRNNELDEIINEYHILAKSMEKSPENFVK